jgi:hypothetical protein
VLVFRDWGGPLPAISPTIAGLGFLLLLLLLLLLLRLVLLLLPKAGAAAES